MAQRRVRRCSEGFKRQVAGHIENRRFDSIQAAPLDWAAAAD